jgi:phosphoglycerate dehydrogenase-like enzyme
MVLMIILSTTPRTNQNLYDFKKIIEPTPYSFLQVNPKGQQFNSNEMRKILADCEIAIIGDDEIDNNAIQDAINLKHIIKWGAGTDSIDFKATSIKNITVTNTPGILGKYVAEYVLGIIISTNRNLFEYNNTLKANQLWNKNPGSSLYGKTVGLIGYGNIGKEIANLLSIFNCKIIFFDPYIQVDDNATKVDLNYICTSSDILIISAKLNSETLNIIDKNVIDKLRENCLLINIARGPLLNEKDVFDAVNNKKLKYLFLDVFNTEPPNLDDYYINNNHINFSQHNASNSFDAIEEVNMKILELIKGLVL